MNNTIVTLKKGEGRSLKAGGLWIFDNGIDTIVGTFTNGDIVVVHDFDGYMLGRGFINQNSKIRIRMMTRDKEQLVDKDFLRMRVQNAWDYRKNVMLGGNTDMTLAGIGTTARPGTFSDPNSKTGTLTITYTDNLTPASFSKAYTFDEDGHAFHFANDPVPFTGF